jgi:hypothetical protein
MDNSPPFLFDHVSQSISRFSAEILSTSSILSVGTGVVLRDFSSVVQCPSIGTIRPCLSGLGHIGQGAFYTCSMGRFIQGSYIYETIRPRDVSTKKNRLGTHRSGTQCHGIHKNSSFNKIIIRNYR